MAEVAALSEGGKIIGGCLIEPIQRELGYLFCFNTNIQELETRLDQLKATKNDVQAREDVEQRSWKTLGEAANLWIVETNGKITEAETVISDKAELQNGCFSIKWCPNLKLRFSLGRKGKRLSLALIDLLQSGRSYLSQPVLALPMPPIIMRHDNDDDADFDTRRKPMEYIIDLLQDKETRLIGICGMGGIGKTTFANQLLQKVQDLHLFGFAFMLTVSSDPNFSTIQQQALKKLGFNPSSTEIVDEKETAQCLRNAFDKKKAVIVLDDVWEEFDLNAKGFSLKQLDVEGCCKIIYTSRFNDLWAGQQTKKEISLPFLSGKESWDLFIRNANLNNDDDDFPSKNEIAREIVDEFKGLPLALKVAGGALIKREIYHWHDMLFRLKNQHEHDSKINKALETSYNSLEHNEKLLFLLCCLFQEDKNIPIESLYRYAVGLQLFKDIMISLREIRSRIYTLVGNLIRRNLLIKDDDFDDHRKLVVEVLERVGDGERVVMMHDVVRDVGISIAKRVNGFSHFVCDGTKDLDSVISVETKTKMISILFPDMDLKFLTRMGFGHSKFELFKLDEYVDSDIDISEDCFQGIDILKVLHVKSLYSWKRRNLYSSFPYLVKLKMLSLEYLNITSNLSSIEHLSCLEILSLRWSSMNIFPNEISELKNLRLLDLTGCDCFIRKGVLSKLTNLEELYMWHSFIDWRMPKEQNFGSTVYDNYAAELIELNHLHKLWRLELMVNDIKQMQRGVKLLSSSKLIEFKISIGGKRLEEILSGNTIFESGERQLRLKNITSNFVDELEDIIKNKITNIYLCNSSFVWENMHVKGFLKDIVLQHCDTITTLLPHSQSLPLRPSNGHRLECMHLKNNQLLDMIKRCEMMEEVGSTSKDREEDKTIEFNSLETLKLNGLCKLECFSKDASNIRFGKLKILELKGLKEFIFPAKFEVPHLEELIIKSLPNLKSLCNFLAPSLKELTIKYCENLIYAFSCSTTIMKKNISRLSKVHIEGCRKLKGIFVSTDSEGEWNKSFQFSNLQELHLESLEELANFVTGEGEKMQNALFYCDKVSFPCLQELNIIDLSKIKYIVWWKGRLYHRDIEESYCEIQQPLFPELKKMTLTTLSDLVSCVGPVNDSLGEIGEKPNALFHQDDDYQVTFPSLEELKIDKLSKINYIVGWNDRLHHRDMEESYGEIQHFLFPKLKNLILISLNELVSFLGVGNNNMRDNGGKQNILFHQNHNYQVSFPCLKDLRIWGLPKINYIVGWNDLYQQRSGNDKNNKSKLEPHILFPILREFKLGDLDNLLHVYESNHPELGVFLFQNLRVLSINGCQKLRYLFSENIGRDNAKNLQILDIGECPMMEVVMKKDDHEYDDNIEGWGTWGRGSISVPNNYFFPLLRELIITRVPELKTFCDVDYSWALPSLGVLSVFYCPKLEALSPGYVNSPKLKTLLYNNIEEDAAGDINNTLPHLFNKDYGDGDGVGIMDAITLRKASLKAPKQLRKSMSFELKNLKSMDSLIY